MKKLPVGLVLVAALVVVGALPAAGAAAHTLPFQADCGDGDVIFDIIAAEGSLVGFERETGEPVVFHGVQGAFVVTVTINDGFFGDARFEEDFLKGRGVGLNGKLTECEADPAFEIEYFAFTIGDDATEADILAFFNELGITGDPGLEDGDVVTFVSTFEGDVQVQFPRG